MKKIAFVAIATLALSSVHAEYTVTIPLNSKIKFYSWTTISPLLGDWTNNGDLYDCSNWSPAESTITTNKVFLQTATDCKQDQTRTVQNRETDSVTGIIRNVGSVYNENNTITETSSRNAIGSLETWSATTSVYTNWVNNGLLISCSNWTPDPSTITINQSFTQTANDCQQPQTRTRQDREQENTTFAIRNKGDVVTENQNISATSTRNSIGTKESWVATTAVSTDWVDTGVVTGCSIWTPDPSTIPVGTTFPQTATDCSQSQTRSTQNREQETTTGAIRNNGAAFNEMRTVPASSTRNATGTKVVQECNGYFTFKMSTQSEIGTYGPTKMTAYWAGSAFYNGRPQNFSYGGYNYVMQSSVSGGGLCRSK